MLSSLYKKMWTFFWKYELLKTKMALRTVKVSRLLKDMLLSIHFLYVYILLGIFSCNSVQCLDTYFSCKINSDIKKMMRSFPNQIYERISIAYDSNIYRALETVQWNSYVDCRNGNICTVYLSFSFDNFKMHRCLSQNNIDSKSKKKKIQFAWHFLVEFKI